MDTHQKGSISQTMLNNNKNDIEEHVASSQSSTGKTNL
jgi:hypothetical protein